MRLSSLMVPLFRRVRRLVRTKAANAVRRVEQRYDRHEDENIAITAAMGAGSSAPDILYPNWYAGFLRESLRLQKHDIVEIKRLNRPATDAANRFNTLLGVLRSEVPPLPIDTAKEIGRVSDSFFRNTTTFIHETYVGDIGLHFRVSSSVGRAGRLISTIVRMMKSNRCLELGTAYGLSALFTLHAMRRNGDGGHLATLEAVDPQFTLASNMLRERFPATSVTCYKGMTSDALAGLVSTLGTVDFLFHDAGHSLKDYVDDFAICEPVLALGAVVLVDDIRWDDPASTRAIRGRTKGGLKSPSIRESHAPSRSTAAWDCFCSHKPFDRGKTLVKSRR